MVWSNVHELRSLKWLHWSEAGDSAGVGVHVQNKHICVCYKKNATFWVLHSCKKYRNFSHSNIVMFCHWKWVYLPLCNLKLLRRLSAMNFSPATGSAGHLNVLRTVCTHVLRVFGVFLSVGRRDAVGSPGRIRCTCHMLEFFLVPHYWAETAVPDNSPYQLRTRHLWAD